MIMIMNQFDKASSRKNMEIVKMETFLLSIWKLHYSKYTVSVW